MEEFNRILLVEDNNNLGYALSEYLKLHHYDVTWIKDGKLAKSAFVIENFHLVLLDVMLPNIDGFEIAQHIKLLNPVIPIVFVTAKNQKVDKIRGYKIGADDFITKPVDEEVLLLRLKAVINRVYDVQGKMASKLFEFNGFQFNSTNNQASFNADSCILTNKESEILVLLCENFGALVYKQNLLMLIWGKSDALVQKSLDVQLVHLRKKISELTAGELIISNQHGKGYKLHWQAQD